MRPIRIAPSNENVRATYKITYVDAEGEPQEYEGVFESYMWVKDTAYSLSDKGSYKIYRKVIAPDTIAGSYWEQVEQQLLN